jgi:hypothetical protein
VVLGPSDWVSYTFTSDASPLRLDVHADGPIQLWLDGTPLAPTTEKGTRYEVAPGVSGRRRLRVAGRGTSVTVRAIDVQTGRRE